MPHTAADIAKLIDATIEGDSTTPLTGFSPAGSARAGDLTFAENEIFFAKAEESAASAVLVDGPFHSKSKTLLRVSNARVGFAKALGIFFPEAVHAAGIHPTAVVDSTAQIDPSAHVGPHCVIGARVRIGAGAVLLGLSQVGEGCSLGNHVLLHPNVTLYPKCQIGNRVRIHAGSVIGADGFGYVLDKGTHLKIPQIGSVIIHDDVEIGAHVAIDRGALGPTVIGAGTKIDNLVQIAHNVHTGEHCLVVAQAGIAGSTRLGSYTTLAGQVGLAGHLKIGSRVVVAAQSGVMNDIPDGQKWLGSPAQPDRMMKRQWIALQRLPELLRRVAELEARLGISEDVGEKPAPNSNEP